MKYFLIHYFKWSNLTTLFRRIAKLKIAAPGVYMIFVAENVVKLTVFVANLQQIVIKSQLLALNLQQKVYHFTA